jgi:hypothetical protein
LSKDPSNVVKQSPAQPRKVVKECSSRVKKWPKCHVLHPEDGAFSRMEKEEQPDFAKLSALINGLAYQKWVHTKVHLLGNENRYVS